MRRVGASIVGETPTLERAIHDFWAGHRLLDNPEEAFVSTACALYNAQLDADEIKLAYRRFIETWNGRSHTVISLDGPTNTEYFLKGIIRGFVRSGGELSDSNVLDTELIALGITYENLPVTNVITSEIVIPDASQRAQKSQAAIQQVVFQAREVAFRQFVTDIYSMEQIKKKLMMLVNKEAALFPLHHSFLQLKVVLLLILHLCQVLGVEFGLLKFRTAMTLI